MQGKIRDISGAQLVMLLFVSRLFTLFTFIPKSGQAVSGSTALLTILLAAAATLLLILPYLWLCRKGGQDILAAAFSASRFYGVLVSACYGTFCILMAGYTASHFEFFMTSTVYQNAPPWIFLLCLIPAAAYAARLGLEAFSRFGVFVFILMLAVIALICGALIPEMDLVNVVSPFLEGEEAVFSGTMQAVTANAEAVVFILLCSRAGKGSGKTFIWYVVLAAIFYEILSFSVLAALGDYAKTRLFPLYTAATVAQISVFGRLDILHIAMWVCVAFLRAAAYLYCALVCLRRIFHKLPYAAAAAIVAVGAGGLAFFTSTDMRYLNEAGRLLMNGVPFGVLVVLIPLITALFLKKGGKSV
ncbi:MULTISPECIES: GerAB/ArcD/ProY family transporter [Anaerotruncus]|uniref:GerAB/ArcD/ProY family transporter n=1 Tax=Anaerotruncus TaxID=244127 RepID=UPI00083510A3|nr:MULTISPECIES: GerAB/ArcD/ProY family transporter [Anaerotruncus]RGX56688.1 hypothetical protein DWV16_03505 [Anaerotruncus sp. AF02-27]